jgi:hypothetical protein
MSLPIYSTGTVSVTAGGTTVTGAGVMWSGINVKQGDFISIAGMAEVLITEVTDAANLKIAPWQGAAQTNAPYIIYQNYVGRVVGVAAAEDVGEMLEKLHVDGLPFIVGADETVPDPSYGDDGQLAFKPSTGEWWVKQGGAWVPSAGLIALGYGGTSATSLLVGTGTKAFTTQGSLAYDGARVRAASAADPNNWMEGVADYFGTSLTMMSDKIHGSGTHADWLFSIAGQPGVDGLGAGDVIGPASAVINNFAAFDATTGKVIKDSGSAAASFATPASVTTAVANSAVRYDAAQSLTAAQQKQARQNIAVNDGNILINSDFRINQRVYAGAAVAAGVYTHDRWKGGAGGGGHNFTQLASSTTITIQASKSIIQVVEDKNVEGGTYVLSWTGTAQGRYGLNSAAPSGTFASSPILITGQTAGTVMSVEFNTGTLGQVKLERGTVPTPYVMSDFSDEFRKCQRYYEKTYPYASPIGSIYTDGVAAGVSGGGDHAGYASLTWQFKVTKRALPSVTFYDGAGTPDVIVGYNGGTWTGGVVIANSGVSDSKVVVLASMYYVIAFQAIAQAEL